MVLVLCFTASNPYSKCQKVNSTAHAHIFSLTCICCYGSEDQNLTLTGGHAMSAFHIET